MIMTCEHATDRLPELAAGTLDTATAAALQAHIAGCAECAAEWRIVQSVRAVATAMPADMAARIGAAVAARNGAARAGAAIMDLHRRRAPHYAVAAAAAIALVGGVLAVHQLRENPPVLTQVDSTTITPAATAAGTFPVSVDPLVGNQSAVSELTEAQLEALLTEMDS